MTIFDLLFAWKLKMLKWAFYAFVLIVILIIIILNSINFSFAHSFLERSLFAATGWQTVLKGDSHFSWMDGPAIEIDHVAITDPVIVDIKSLEIPIYKLMQIWGMGHYGIEFQITADSLEIDNFLFEDVSVKGKVFDYDDATIHITADHGTLNTANGDPAVSRILNEVLPAGNNSAELKCLSAPFVVKNNIAKTDNTIMETGAAYLVWTGTADFNTQMLDFKITPQSKSSKAEIPPAPVQLTGPFEAPQFTISPTEIIARMQMLLKGQAIETEKKVECDEEIL